MNPMAERLLAALPATGWVTLRKAAHDAMLPGGTRAALGELVGMGLVEVRPSDTGKTMIRRAVTRCPIEHLVEQPTDAAPPDAPAVPGGLERFQQRHGKQRGVA